MNSLIEQFNALSSREKIILLATFSIVLWGVWDNFFYQPLTNSHNQLKSELSAVKEQIAEKRNIASQLEVTGKADPNLLNKQKLDQIKNKLKHSKSQLGIGEKAFVSAHLMIEVLHDMLQQSSGLKLIKLESLPVTSLTKNDQEHSGVYRHGLTITLSGSYLNTLKYLQSLEALPWKFSWDRIDYQVKKYPLAETTLRVYTLSFEENWLGL